MLAHLDPRPARAEERLHLRAGTLNPRRAPLEMGMPVHRQRDRLPAGELHGDDLMIHHVVIAVVDASPVGAGLEGGAQIFGGGVVGDDGDGPAAVVADQAQVGGKAAEETHHFRGAGLRLGGEFGDTAPGFGDGAPEGEQIDVNERGVVRAGVGDGTPIQTTGGCAFGGVFRAVVK